MKNRIKCVLVLLAVASLTASCGKEEGKTANKTEGGKEPVSETSSVNGQAVYQENCSECHKTGVAGAPVIGDSAAWEPRISKGKDSLVQSVIYGKGNMPPKAGSPALSEEEISAAVEYMTSQVQSEK